MCRGWAPRCEGPDVFPFVSSGSNARFLGFMRRSRASSAGQAARPRTWSRAGEVRVIQKRDGHSEIVMTRYAFLSRQGSVAYVGVTYDKKGNNLPGKIDSGL